MACIYELNGNIFNSEIELDDFLLEKFLYYPTIGDIVFSIDPEKANTLSTIDTIKKEASKSIKAYQEAKRVFTEDGAELVFKRPKIGTTEFLSKFRNMEGERLFPQFNADDFEEDGEKKLGYWSRRYELWAIGKFTEDEISLFFEGDTLKITPILDKAILKLYREKMEKRWKKQSEVGSEVHKVLLIYFSKIPNKFLSESEKGKEIYYFLRPELLNKKLESDINYSLVSKDNVLQTLDVAKNLYNKLKDELGDNISFFPELSVTAKVKNTIDPNATDIVDLMGMIDLLVIDSKGMPHIIDYKTSTKSYEKFNSAKKLGFTYLLETYRRLLLKYGIRMDDSRTFVVPLELQKFTFDPDSDKVSFSNVGTTGYIMEEITQDVEKEYINNNLDEFIPVEIPVHITTKDIIENVSNQMSEWFKGYESFKLLTDDELREELKKGGFFEPAESGMYEYKPKNSFAKPITAKSEVELFEKVKKSRQSTPKRRLELVKSVIRALKAGLRNDTDIINLPTADLVGEDLVSSEWFRYHMHKYCNHNWSVIENEALAHFGIIALRNKSGLVDFIKISSNRMKYKNHFGNSSRMGLTGNYEEDINHQAEGNSLMLEAANGNVELMETMLVINNIKGLFNGGSVVGNLAVYDPRHGEGVSASNAELLYCFNRLSKFKAIPEGNNFKNGSIKMATKFENCVHMYHQIMTLGEENKWKGNFKGFSEFTGCTAMIDEAVESDIPDKINALNKLLKVMDKNNFNRKLTSDQSELSSYLVSLYNQVLLSLAELLNINFRQLLDDHGKWFENLAIWKKGVSGTYIDNPGNLNSETLNLVTKLVTEAYQNVRLDLASPRAKLYKLTEALKKEKGFNSMINNQAELYKNMIEERDGDLFFVRPETLGSKAERDLLEYVLDTINHNRHSEKSETALQQMKDSGALSYYRVPLAYGDTESQVAAEGLLRTFKHKLQNWDPRVAADRARLKLEGLTRNESSHTDSSALFEMNNIFNKGEKTESRLEFINKVRSKGGNFERNLETLCLKHVFAYSTKNNMDKVFPMMKAAMVHLTTLGFVQNTDFTLDKEYLKEYIQNKVKNETIISKELRPAAEVLNGIKSAASKLTLALSPVQGLYLSIQGIWNAIGLIIQRPEIVSVLGKKVFSYKNVKDAFISVYKDLIHVGNSPTLNLLINLLYGINDMDMNSYVDKVKTDLGGIWNMTNFLFKLASRPDFYNRMTIFGALMRADGCWNAHSINSDGELVYNFREDERFSILASGNTNHPNYTKQRALYIATAKQFVREHAKYYDGKEFVLDFTNFPPLPRAYTNLQAEGYKTVSDTIYGYYSNEKKSLIQATFLGSMWMQFRTFWSGKKNLYLGKGAVRLAGQMKHIKDKEGNLLYYELDEKGVPTDLPTTQPNDYPMYQWEGEWQEGVALSVVNTLIEGWNSKNLMDAFYSKWNNPDERLRNAYRANYRKLLYDLLMFILIGGVSAAIMGDWLKELKEETKDSNDITEGLKVAAANILTHSVANSFMDFNFIESIGSPISSWTPFSVEWGGRTLKNLYRIASGNGDIWDGFVNSVSALKQTKPLWDTLKPDLFNSEN